MLNLLTIDWNKIWNSSEWELMNLSGLDRFIFGLVCFAIAAVVIIVIVFIGATISVIRSNKKEAKKILKSHHWEGSWFNEVNHKTYIRCSCGERHWDKTKVGEVLTKLHKKELKKNEKSN